ncbi:hypothetical protein QUA56_11815 [Microcoleus sp. N3A4]|uniref:hypothetical protein n=1 Tax=Microcoleus sp. N3A4 TaxID=3055379 RepID=UPI002FD43939
MNAKIFYFCKGDRYHQKLTFSGALVIVSAGNVATSARSLVAPASILLTTLGIGALMEWRGLI